MLSVEELTNKSIFPIDEWKFISFNNEYHVINTFDDGNQKFMNYENKWILFARWKGKAALYNLQNPKIIIASISLWKVNNGIKIEN
mgnify:CR=1 FL=1|tara:strand:- start:35077 stop:35334 length:258 start_codon:yes stop_codon:yes gene_type:complete